MERVHQTIDNIMLPTIIQQIYLDNENPWEGIWSSTMFTIRSLVYTSMKHTSSELVFCRDTILNINKEANKQLNKNHKQALINKGNQKEYCCSQSHVYHTGDKVLFKKAWKTKFNKDKYAGPFTMSKVQNSGTVRARRGNVTDTYNL